MAELIPKTAMLMSAGLGKRLLPFTKELPKPLVPVLGIPILQYALDVLNAHGFKRAVINSHHLPDVMLSGLQDLDRGNLEIKITDESKELLGSAGGIRFAQEHLDDPFVLINSDVLFAVDLAALWRRHEELGKPRMTMAIHRTGFTSDSYGEMQIQDGKWVVATSASKKLAPFYLGASVMHHEALKDVPFGKPGEFVPLILEPAMKAKQAGALFCEDPWFDTGSPDLWKRTHFQLLELLEQDQLPSYWKDRLNAVNEQVAKLQWKTKSATGKVKNWTSPCYWGSEENCPAAFGPNEIYYSETIKL